MRIHIESYKSCSQIVGNEEASEPPIHQYSPKPFTRSEWESLPQEQEFTVCLKTCEDRSNQIIKILAMVTDTIKKTEELTEMHNNQKELQDTKEFLQSCKQEIQNRLEAIAKFKESVTEVKSLGTTLTFDQKDMTSSNANQDKNPETVWLPLIRIISYWGFISQAINGTITQSKTSRTARGSLP